MKELETKFGSAEFERRRKEQNPRGCVFNPEKVYAQNEKLGEKQMKKYKLNIPEMIGVEYADAYITVRRWHIVTEAEAQDNNIPETWLEEIKEQPKVLSAGEWLASSEFASNAGNRTIYKAGEENGQLREWLRHEQVELRSAAYYISKIRPPNNHELAFENLKQALENLKPPYERK